MLTGKRILLGVTGSIAAYKSALIVRELVRNGADVRVVCTPSALDFVTPLTLSTLSKNPVHSSFLANTNTGEWVNHVELGKWADLMLIAPLSANTLSKLGSGQCDNLLLATYLSADCPITVAPAMDLDMHAHWTTNENLEGLSNKGVAIIDSEEGELASGLIGKGRMAEPETIVNFVKAYFETTSVLAGKKILVTAGPTYEKIDPVRFIGNHSSGKMGYAVANEAAKRGAEVILISGPTSLKCEPATTCVRVTSAAEMMSAVDEKFTNADVLIMSAAVADYRPSKPFDSKQKKLAGGMDQITLEPTQDILGDMGKKKQGDQKLIGFALETDDELANGRKKLQNKNLDMLVLNSLNDKGAGFGTDTNKITFVFADGEKPMPLKTKAEVANDILDELEGLY